MNYQERRKQEASVWNSLTPASQKKKNCVLLEGGNIEHVFCQFLIGWIDFKAKIKFFQEAKFITGGEGDHLRQTGECFEVMSSETKKKGEYKLEKYPPCVFVDFLTLEQVIKWFKDERPRDFEAIKKLVNSMEGV